MSANKSESLEPWLNRIEQGLSQLAVDVGSESPRLQEAAQYVLGGGGKRLRALLTLAVAKDLSKSGEAPVSAFKAAVAIEALHAASLVHDDLPALDNDDVRRGRPSCHKAFGEATAILLGDLLVGAAFEIFGDQEVALEKQARLSGVLARAWRELCVGQQLDIESPTGAAARERMIELKTGKLFGAAVACGAIASGMTDHHVDALSAWGVKLGVLFQKLDDLDDGERAQSERATVDEASRLLLDQLRTVVPRDLSNARFVAERALHLA